MDDDIIELLEKLSNLTTKEKVSLLGRTLNEICNDDDLGDFCFDMVDNKNLIQIFDEDDDQIV